ncbi:FabD/lysophospholipase-like protein [Lojkania enalia]|uniref:FabD/lysophospholipase-like protein n=1 Tax=Lojkania enalia TaxID=147567 RepID=A0A9P4JZM9_9PLEO|nr:FabD/lysophospholipase-like protein [Didymosphaeria enalia]
MATENHNLRLLCLDGGGIRGLSTLLIIQRIMFVLDSKVDPAIERPLRPCHFFDLMAGTSTGGLICIMLGTMRMTIDECITAYLELAPKIFPEEGILYGSKAGKLFKSFRGAARFDAMALEEEVKNMVANALKKDKDVAFDQVEALGGCRVYVVVCATNKDVNKPVRLRSYRSSWEPSTNCTIWQVARATSAAPLYFDPIIFGTPPMSYVDGGLHYNNPIRVALDETKAIWKGTPTCRVGCIVSVGTGVPPLTAVGERGLEILESLKSLVTDTEDTARDFENELEHMDAAEQPAYFRFNVQNMQKIGLEEWKEFNMLTGATNSYLYSQRKDIDRCASILLNFSSMSH